MTILIMCDSFLKLHTTILLHSPFRNYAQKRIMYHVSLGPNKGQVAYDLILDHHTGECAIGLLDRQDKCSIPV